MYIEIYLTYCAATTLLTQVTLQRSDNKPFNDYLASYDLIHVFYFIFVSTTLCCLCQPCVFSIVHDAELLCAYVYLYVV